MIRGIVIGLVIGMVFAYIYGQNQYDNGRIRGVEQIAEAMMTPEGAKVGNKVFKVQQGTP